MKQFNQTKKIATNIAIATAICASGSVYANSPFALNSLTHGYHVAEVDTKMMDGKCGGDKKNVTTEKCVTAETKTKDGKCGEGKCGGSSKKMTEAETCQKTTNSKMKDGKCGGAK